MSEGDSKLPGDNKINRSDRTGELTVQEAIEFLGKSQTDVTGKEYIRTIAVWRDPENPSLLQFTMNEAAG